MIALLIIMDFLWAFLAITVDLPKLLHIPFYLWPLVAICPIYPFLLALVFLGFLRKQRVGSYLLLFAAFPSAVFGVLAIIYYPCKMFYGGFNWIDFGQIFWVLFYSVQGWYLLINKKLSLISLITVFCFLCVKFAVDYKYLTFGYLDLTMLSREAVNNIFVSAFATSLMTLFFALKFNRKR